MDYRIMIQGTPNPNALKFITNVPVKTTGNITYKNTGTCGHNPLAEKIFGASPAVKEVYFFDNYITVTQDGTGDWDDLEDRIQKVIMDNIAAHDPDFKVEEPKRSDFEASQDDPELAKINAILDQTVRPALQMDGGDLQVLGLNGNILSIAYQGACGSCPSATMGTMKAIENLLRDQYNPEIIVELA